MAYIKITFKHIKTLLKIRVGHGILKILVMKDLVGGALHCLLGRKIDIGLSPSVADTKV